VKCERNEKDEEGKKQKQKQKIVGGGVDADVCCLLYIISKQQLATARFSKLLCLISWLPNDESKINIRYFSQPTFNFNSAVCVF
jgi:hypothetical protein